MLRKPVPKRVGRPPPEIRSPAPPRTVPAPSEGRPVSLSHAVPPLPAIPFIPATDLLGHTARLEERAVYPLLGIPVEIRSNSPAVLVAADRSFGNWRGLAPERIAAQAPLCVSVVVQAGKSWELRPTAFVQRAYGDCFLAAAESNLLTARMDLGQALAFVTPELVSADLVFRRTVLECLALLLVGRHDRTPLHAAAVVRNGRTLVLAGPNGCGKSTLCYACLKADFQLLTDELLHVSVHDGVRLWGMPGQLHMPSDAPRLFPELADLTTEQQSTGKLKIALEVARFGADRACWFGERPVVCLLQRQRRSSSALEPLDRVAVRAAFAQGEPGFGLHPEAVELAARLADGGAYRLHLGADPASAVKRLQELTNP